MNNGPRESEYGICEYEKEESPLSQRSPFPLFVIPDVGPHIQISSLIWYEQLDYSVSQIELVGKSTRLVVLLI